MAKILIVSSGRTSIRNQCIGLAHRLEAGGHEATFAGPERVRKNLEQNGVRFVALETMADTDRQTASPLSDGKPAQKGILAKGIAWLTRIRAAADLRAQAQDKLIDSGFRSLVKRVQPDLVLVELELQAYAIAAHGLAQRTAMLCTFVSSRKVPGVPPLHTAIQPGRGLAGSRLGISAAWLRYRAWKMWQYTLEKIKAPGSDPIAVLRGLAIHTGFPAHKEFVLYDWLLPLSFRTIPSLNLNALEFDFPHRPHSTQNYTGPLIWPARNDSPEQLNPIAAQALQTVLNTRDSGRKLVYCAFGTAFAGNDTAFLKRLLEAMGQRPGWDVLVTLGGRLIEGGFGPLPSHVQLFDWLPQLEVLAHADCAVLHAGPASIYECVHSHVPMVLYPFAVNDQLGYAARASFHGLALVGDRERDDPAQIVRTVERALADQAILQSLHVMDAHIRRYDATNAAVHAVEQLLSQ